MRMLLPLLVLVPAASAQEVGSLAWMAGTWSGAKDGVESEESWTAPRGGAMLGVHRDVRAGRMVGFEFLRIDTEKEGLTYWASPGGRPATHPWRSARYSLPPSSPRLSPRSTTAAPADLNGLVIVFEASSRSPTTPMTGVG